MCITFCSWVLVELIVESISAMAAIFLSRSVKKIWLTYIFKYGGQPSILLTHSNFSHQQLQLMLMHIGVASKIKMSYHPFHAGGMPSAQQWLCGS